MKSGRIRWCVCAVVVSAFSVVTIGGFAQNGSAATPGNGNAASPAPKNLKVLPPDLTGAQVREVMEQWATDLGAHCNTCHTADQNSASSNVVPRLNYADDSKQEKNIARMMYSMTQGINKNYISKIDNSGVPVSCGTCHRGHLGPLPYSGAQ